MVNEKLYQQSLQKIVGAVEEHGKSYLITGASGLIGSCLVDLMMLANQQGHCNHIYALGRSKRKLEVRFKDYLPSDYFHIIEQDICKPLEDSIKLDFIIHGASNADPINYAKYPAETMKINMLGSINILEYARKHSGCKVEMLSTFEVYGNAGKDDYYEEDVGILDFNQLRSCYPESKRAIETLAKCYQHEYGVHVNVGRLCSIYGPTMGADDSKAHSQFLRKALAGEDIVLKSKGEQRRTYCYVIDAVSGILCVLFRGQAGEAYNISNENAVVTIAEMAQTIAKISGRSVVFDLPSDLEKKGFSTPQNCVLNNEKLKSLGWEGSYDIQEGLRETIMILTK